VDKKHMGQNAANSAYDFVTGRSSIKKAPDEDFDSDFSMVERIALDHGAKCAVQVEYINCNEKGVIGTEFEAREPPAGRKVVYMREVFRRKLNDVPAEAVFVDPIHLTHIGESITAGEIHKFFLENGLIESPAVPAQPSFRSLDPKA
jgi:hypothetical protein